MASRSWDLWTAEPPATSSRELLEEWRRSREILAACSRCDWTCSRAEAEREGPIRALLIHNLGAHIAVFNVSKGPRLP